MSWDLNDDTVLEDAEDFQEEDEEEFEPNPLDEVINDNMNGLNDL